MTYLIDVFLHLDMYLDTVIQQYGVWMYLILFVVVFLETGVVVTPFLPGDSLLFAAGALCARGDLAVGWLFLLLWLAAVLGDTVNYSIGHRIGPRAFHGQNRFFKRRASGPDASILRAPWGEDDCARPLHPHHPHLCALCCRHWSYVLWALCDV